MYKPRGSRRLVQKDVATAGGAPACTNPPIDKSVQAPIVLKMQIGAFRKSLKSVLDGEQAVILSTSWRTRGIVIPVRSYWQYSGNTSEARNENLERLFALALKELRD